MTNLVRGVCRSFGSRAFAFPGNGMSKRSISVVMLAAAAWLSQATPVRAQIASYLSEQGKLVFGNEDSPRTRHGSTISGVRLVASKGSLMSTPPDRLDRIVREAAQRHQVDPELVKAVISTESGWNPTAVSRKGAVGLMQLIPETAQRYGVGNSYDPAQNVEGGTAYLRSLLDRYNGDLNKSLAAYNAGERAVDESGGVPPILETRRYVEKVTDAYFRPGSGRDPASGDPPRAPIRQEVDSKGRVVFTNE